MLALFINRAKAVDQLSGVVPHLIDGDLSILQYADDTILFMDHNLEHAHNMKTILCAFEQLLGLKINFHKSEIFFFGEVKNYESQYMELFGCNPLFQFFCTSLPLPRRTSVCVLTGALTSFSIVAASSTSFYHSLFCTKIELPKISSPTQILQTYPREGHAANLQSKGPKGGASGGIARTKLSRPWASKEGPQLQGATVRDATFEPPDQRRYNRRQGIQ